ncbi:MAG: hypothetical protein KKE16_03245 [Firmicutes bacterium]|nr:hypothetical protein [Bacillota bacterium]
MKKRIILLSVSSIVFILASIVMLGFTYGWWVSLVNYPDNEISVGDLRYTPSGGFITGGASYVYLPGEELIDSTITIDNASPIDSQLRVKIEYTKWTFDVTLQSETVVYTASASDHIYVGLDANLQLVGDYYYYGGDSNVLSPDSGLMTLITSLYYDGSVTTFDYAGQEVTVTITIEVKQGGDLTWSDLIGYDFSTGYPE